MGSFRATARNSWDSAMACICQALTGIDGTVVYSEVSDNTDVSDHLPQTGTGDDGHNSGGGGSDLLHSRAQSEVSPQPSGHRAQSFDRLKRRSLYPDPTWCVI